MAILRKAMLGSSVDLVTPQRPIVLDPDTPVPDPVQSTAVPTPGAVMADIPQIQVMSPSDLTTGYDAIVTQTTMVQMALNQPYPANTDPISVASVTATMQSENFAKDIPVPASQSATSGSATPPITGTGVTSVTAQTSVPSLSFREATQTIQYREVSVCPTSP